MRLAPEARQRAADLEQLPLVVTGPDGQPRTLPLGQIATITQSLGPAQVTHLDGDLVVTVQANTSERSLTEVMNDINARVAKLTLPQGVIMTAVANPKIRRRCSAHLRGARHRGDDECT